MITTEDKQEIIQMIQQHFRQNYDSGAPAIPPHTHNGVDNLRIPIANLLGTFTTPVTGLNGFQTFTAGGTFTVPTGFTKFNVVAVGGGQGGTTKGNGGGQAGDYCQSLVTPTGIVTVTIGGAGSPSAGNGGDTSFGSYVIAKGGGSGTTSVGTLIIVGQAGGNGLQSASLGSTSFVTSGLGGSSPLGMGGVINVGVGSGANAGGGNATGYGGGGGNGISSNSSGGTGGTGTGGLVLIYW